MKMRHKNALVTARPHTTLSTGEVIRMLRELKRWTQGVLAERSGISPTNLSLQENDRVDIGKKRVLQLAKAFGVHPATIMFPEFEAREIRKGA
jgi:transcriptional regulator with XRE-family HTH domain